MMEKMEKGNRNRTMVMITKYKPTTNRLTNLNGMSLVEILVVLAILSMLVLLVLPLYPSSASHHEIEFVVKQFEEDFFFVQQKAMTESKAYRIMINPLIHRYFVQDLSANTRLFTRDMPANIRLSTNFTGNNIHINSNGHLSGGNVSFDYKLNDKRQRKKYVFQINTGRVQVEHYEY